MTILPKCFPIILVLISSTLAPSSLLAEEDPAAKAAKAARKQAEDVQRQAQKAEEVKDKEAERAFRRVEQQLKDRRKATERLVKDLQETVRDQEKLADATKVEATRKSLAAAQTKLAVFEAPEMDNLADRVNNLRKAARNLRDAGAIKLADEVDKELEKATKSAKDLLEQMPESPAPDTAARPSAEQPPLVPKPLQ